MDPADVLRRALLDVPGGFRGAVRVDKNGTVLLDSAYGTDGAEMGLQPSTQFQIASISKTFTAATVLALVDDARLSLDDRLADWMNDAPESWSKITLHHLLTHTSGLPHWDGVPALDLLQRFQSRRSPCTDRIRAASIRAGRKLVVQQPRLHPARARRRGRLRVPMGFAGHGTSATAG